MKSDVSQSESHALANVIRSLNTTHFTSSLGEYLGVILDFDCALILGYSEGKRPVYLYDSIYESRELLFQRYLTDSFLNDPFYQIIQREGRERVYLLKDVLSSTFEYKQYQNDFYTRTGWNDELCVSVRLPDHRWIVIYLGVMAERTFTSQSVETLEHRFDIVQSLCLQHWAKIPFSLPDAPKDLPHIRHAIEQTLAQLGSELLTQREQEVAALLVQGFDSKEIATHLDIGVGTVKNHRKRIYSKLNVSSLSELFHIFLTQLIAAG